MERVLVSVGAPSVARRITRGGVSVLAYHNVVPDGEAGRGDSGLHLPLSRFLEQIERVRRSHEILALEAVAMAQRRSRRPRAVITFDDAYRGAVTLALPELARRAIPATMFVAPAILGEPSLWWDELAEAGRLTPALREHALRGQKGRLEPVRRWAFGAAPRPSLPPSYGVASRQELLEHLGDTVVLGAHGWDHAYLPALERDELRQDLGRALRWLRDCPARCLPWLALPYGAGSPAVTEVAGDLGFEALLEIAGGRFAPGAGVRVIPRINVPAGLSLRGLELRMSGVIA